MDPESQWLALPAGAYCSRRPLDAAARTAPSHLVHLAQLDRQLRLLSVSDSLLGALGFRALVPSKWVGQGCGLLLLPQSVQSGICGATA